MRQRCIKAPLQDVAVSTDLRPVHWETLHDHFRSTARPVRGPHRPASGRIAKGRRSAAGASAPACADGATGRSAEGERQLNFVLGAGTKGLSAGSLIPDAAKVAPARTGTRRRVCVPRQPWPDRPTIRVSVISGHGSIGGPGRLVSGWQVVFPAMRHHPRIVPASPGAQTAVPAFLAPPIVSGQPQTRLPQHGFHPGWEQSADSYCWQA